MAPGRRGPRIGNDPAATFQCPPRPLPRPESLLDRASVRSRWIQPDWRKWELGGRLDPTTGALVEGGIEAQTRQVFANLDAVLAAAGSSFADVVKVNVFLTDMADFSTVNTIYATIFSEPHPARTTIAVAGLPQGAALEVELVAHAR